MRYHYLPGCSLHGSAREYADSFQAVSSRLGIELLELKDWNCCGATAAKAITDELPLLLAARNLILAQEPPGNIMVPCNLCYNNLAKGAHLLKDPDLKKKVNLLLQPAGLKLETEVAVRHPLDVYCLDIGLAEVIARVVRPLEGWKVISYYGCLLTRPKEVAIPDSNYHPQLLDNLVRGLGAQPLPFSGKTTCCGGPLLLTDPNVAYSATRKLLDEARELGADCFVVTCPMCHLSLDGKQKIIEKKYNTKYDIPVFYFTQLMGLALGVSPKDLGLKRHLVSPFKLLGRV
ncbi:MAG: CoB--CoM heterodisulfide reductase iron-sulfur subunit B family protein [Firmicutes bacterium]|nr:CoB--CoM heterodisulfide reductase iron-sulfur subunit B family protein [Bacillota bacterium]MCL5040410.1 CoB--CoM heterodisulfide reductase iron-sulfur subunit B family protein [Bacillota bacterium]